MQNVQQRQITLQRCAEPVERQHLHMISMDHNKQCQTKNKWSITSLLYQNKTKKKKRAAVTINAFILEHY